jgi:glucosyl-3-phosphoglycerate synthase
VRTSVVLPAREEAATVGPIVASVIGAHQVLVVDAASEDGTAEVATAAGAEVVQESELLPEFGPVLGKGDAMWRSLSVVTGDVVVFLDADARQVSDTYVSALAGALEDPAIQLVKAHYRRPFKGSPEGGGRVTELLARPLLRAFYPELARIRQPLAGETAARRELLVRLPFSTGYGVEIALLIDAWKEVGIDAIAQVDLGVRENRHQPLSELGRMADAVLGAVTTRLEHEGRLRGEHEERPVERPPYLTVSAPSMPASRWPGTEQ